jgi:hypothetical protein
MLLDLRLAEIVPGMSGATIECVHATAGSVLKPGAKLLDLSVDLSAAFAQECPPISFFRVILREPAVLRQIGVAPGQHCELGEVLALFSSTGDDPIEGAADRAVRLATAGIMHHSDMWTGSHR